MAENGVGCRPVAVPPQTGLKSVSDRWKLGKLFFNLMKIYRERQGYGKPRLHRMAFDSTTKVPTKAPTEMPTETAP